MDMCNKVVVWLHHGLGDVIMGLPMLVSIDAALAENAQLLVVVKSDVEVELINTLKWRSNLTVQSMGYKGKWNRLSVFNTALALRRWQADVFLAPHAADSFSAALFARIVAPKRLSVGPEGKWGKWGYKVAVSAKPDQHKAKYYSSFAEAAGLYRELVTTIPYVKRPLADPGLQALLRDLDDGGALIVCSPGSSSLESHKRWMPSSYSALIAQLLAIYSNARVLLLGSPAEVSLLESIRAEVSSTEHARIFVATPSKITDAIAAINRASCLVCGCTGAGHMAALAGTPIVGIYGPTNYAFTGPFTDQLRIVAKGYACSPCYRPGFLTGCGDPRCMRDVTVDEVVQAVSDTLQGKPFPLLPKVKTTSAETFIK